MLDTADNTLWGKFRQSENMTGSWAMKKLGSLGAFLFLPGMLSLVKRWYDCTIPKIKSKKLHLLQDSYTGQHGPSGQSRGLILYRFWEVGSRVQASTNIHKCKWVDIIHRCLVVPCYHGDRTTCLFFKLWKPFYSHPQTCICVLQIYFHQSPLWSSS